MGGESAYLPVLYGSCAGAVCGHPMTPARFRWTAELAVAIASADAQVIQERVLREDGQEDLCFILWHPSTGATRTSAVVADIVLPMREERHVHGNVDFTGAYFLRAAAMAVERGCGLGLLHSHPGGQGWQGLSTDDRRAEGGHAAQASSITGLPLLGLTVAGDGHWSGRFWRRLGARTYQSVDCRSVRRAGDRFDVSFDPAQVLPPGHLDNQRRSVAAWGPRVQAGLSPDGWCTSCRFPTVSRINRS